MKASTVYIGRQSKVSSRVIGSLILGFGFHLMLSAYQQVAYTLAAPILMIVMVS